jgi:hypothetical protein
MATWRLLRPSRLDADEAVVWFENGRVVHDDPRLKRDPLLFAETDIDDPVLRLENLIGKWLWPHAAFTTAVSYARLGK